MCNIMEEERLEGKLESLLELVEDNLLSENIAIQKSNLTSEEYAAAKKKWLKSKE